jgi:hypothetical protein
MKCFREFRITGVPGSPAASLLRLATVLLIASAALPAAEFHVAQRGNDANPGSRTHPFATIERARDEVRRMNAAGAYPGEGVTVWLHGGVYLREHSFDLDGRDSGRPGSPLTRNLK